MNVLVVDDDILILEGLRRALFKTGWQLNFSTSSELALQKLSQIPFDFVIADMRMPGMDGAELLEKVSEHYPSVVRIMLSGFSDIDAIKRATFVAHQWFSKPCDPQELKTELNRIYDIRGSLPNKDIQEIVGKIKALPSPPKIFMRIKSLLRNEECNLDSVAELIEEDPSLSAKILQISNSSFFVHGNPAKNLEVAIARLGLDIVCSVVLLAESFSQIDDECGFSVEKEQQKSVATARLASALVSPEYKEEALLGGLLHDIGKLIFYKISPKALDVFRRKGGCEHYHRDLERKLFGADHTQLAGYLLHLWNFPYSLIEAIVTHHSPHNLLSDTFTPGAAIYVANQLIENEELDPLFIEHFALKDKLASWKAMARDFRPPG